MALVDIAGLAADSFAFGLDLGFQLGDLALEFVDAQAEGEYLVGLHLVAHVLETDDVGQSRDGLLAVLRPRKRHCLFAHYLNIINCQSAPYWRAFPTPLVPARPRPPPPTPLVPSFIYPTAKWIVLDASPPLGTPGK